MAFCTPQHVWTLQANGPGWDVPWALTNVLITGVNIVPNRGDRLTAHAYKQATRPFRFPLPTPIARPARRRRRIVLVLHCKKRWWSTCLFSRYARTGRRVRITQAFSPLGAHTPITGPQPLYLLGNANSSVRSRSSCLLLFSICPQRARQYYIYQGGFTTCWFEPVPHQSSGGWMILQVELSRNDQEWGQKPTDSRPG